MTQNALLKTVAQAIETHVALPEIDAKYALEEAYELQHEVTALRSPNGRGGVKLGVTTQAAQGFFGLDHALLGSLYVDAQLSNDATFSCIEGRNLETEFAVKVDAQGQPLAIAPAIEIVYVNFSRQADLSAANLVLSNLGADLYLVGEFLPWDSPHLDVTAVLRRDDEVVNEASMNDALGGPTAALPWVWEEIQNRGYQPTGETLIMMGACGAVVPAEAGHYQADYGAMGQVRFSVE